VSSKTLTAAFAACLFLLVVTAKWAVFDRFGSPMPDWDQWDAEGGELFVPWHTNDRFLSHLFHPHNEHRVILTKLQNLTLGLFNGQWDSRLEASTNAMLHAAIAVAFFVCACRWLAAGWRPLVFLVLLALFGLPVAWQNVLGGFHSQQFWLLALSFLAIVTLPFSPAWSRRWWLGALAAILVLGSMGSGLLAGAVAMVVVAWRWMRREISARDAWPTLALGVLVIAVGLSSRVDVEWHQHMKAKSVHDFCFNIVHSLQWPWRERHWAAAVLWFPWVLAAWRVLRSPRRRPESPEPPWAGDSAGPAIVALGGWVVVQLVATAYARGANADYPASRYMDTLSFGAAVNALALGWLLTHPPARRAGYRALHVAGLAWVLTFGGGLHFHLATVFQSELPDAKKYYLGAEGHMRRYLATNDPKALAYPDISYPSAQGIIDHLGAPSLRAMMPVPLRLPLVIEARSGPTSPFVENNAVRAAQVAESPPRQGLSPALEPLDYTRTWGSFGTGSGEWRSQPVAPPARRAWLRFQTAGHLGESGVALEIRDAATDALLAEVRPSKIPGDTWRSAYAPAPRVPYVVVARDQDATRWLAFSGPVEMGYLSYLAWQTNKHAWLMLNIAAAATALLAFLAWWQRRGLAAATRDSPA
jgi:hypothetical protein